MGGEPNEVKWRGVRPVAGIRGVWPSVDSDTLYKYLIKTTAGFSIVYTVPANKIAFITSAHLNGRTTIDQTVLSAVGVRNVGDTPQYSIIDAYYSLIGSKNFSDTFFPALIVPEGWDVYLYNQTTNMNSRCTIFGWLEDA